jgi:uncharacterized membrane protein
MQKIVLVVGIVMLLIGIFYWMAPSYANIEKNVDEAMGLYTKDSASTGLQPNYQTIFNDLNGIKNNISFLQGVGFFIFIVGIVLVMCGFGLPNFEKRIRKE